MGLALVRAVLEKADWALLRVALRDPYWSGVALSWKAWMSCGVRMREDCWETLEGGRDLALEMREMRAAVYRGAEGIFEALREAMISPMVAALVVVGVD